MTEKQKGIFALVLVAVAWGVLPIFPRFLSQSFALYQQLYVRIGSAFVFSILFFRKDLSLKKILRIPGKDLFLIVLRSLSYWILGAGAMTASLLLTKVSNVMFIQAIPMTAIFGVILLHEKFNKEILVLVVLSFVGILIVSVNDVNGLLRFGLGELLSLFSVIAFSFSLVARKWQTDHLNDRELSTLSLFIAFILTIVISLIIKEGPLMWNGDFTLFGIIIASGIIIAGMNFFLNFAYKRVEAIVSGPILSLEIFLSIIFAFIVFQETPTIRVGVGGILVLLSSVTMQIMEYKRAGGKR